MQFLGLLLEIAGMLSLHPALAQQIETSASASSSELGTFSGAKPTEYLDWFKESFLEFSDDIAEAAEQGKRVMLLTLYELEERSVLGDAQAELLRALLEHDKIRYELTLTWSEIDALMGNPVYPY